jgi:hypothetical protein
VGFAVLGPLIGLVSDISTLSFALILSGHLLLIMAIFAGYRLVFHMPETFHH